MPITRPWKIAGAAALSVGTIAGVAAARDGGFDLRDRADTVELTDSASADDAAADLSPESADSPAESPFDSPESPTDSPDDPGWVDPSPESADSPAESPADSPAPAPAPAPSGGGGGGGGGGDSAGSVDSPDAGSADSD
jgi:hypothetical protein